MAVRVEVDELKAAIRDVKDFPKKGVVFKDVTTLFLEPALFRRAGDLLAELCRGRAADKVVAIESRGFIVGALLADRLGLGFVPVRKPGKLPSATIRATYELEYGTDTLEMHADALRPGDRLLVVDDVIATGGTAKAVADLAQQLGATVSAFAFLIELGFLNGRAKLAGHEVLSVIQY